MRRFLYSALGIALSALSAAPADAVSFSFTTINGDSLTPDQAAAFTTAANAWSSRLSDPITISLAIGFRSLGGNILGGASPTIGSLDANVVKTLLQADVTSADDRSAVVSLPSYGLTDQLTLTSAQARAIGISSATPVSDGMIEFSSDYSYSTSRDVNGGIVAGTFDLIGIAEHEIEHILGFVSSLDIGGSPTVLDQYRYASYGNRSVVAGTSAYFSLNGGMTDIAEFSIGGAGNYQASHWLSGTTVGGRLALMNPAIAPGQVQDLTALDVRAADVIGYDVSAVPEPTSWAMIIFGLGAIGFRLRQKRRLLSQQVL